MRNPYPKAAGAPTLPPQPPLGRNTTAWRGNPPPRPHLPGVQSWPRRPASLLQQEELGCRLLKHCLFLPASHRGFLLCPLTLHPQPSTLCPITPASPSASSTSRKIPFWPVIAAPRPRRLRGWCAGRARLPLPEPPQPTPHSQLPPCLHPLLWPRPIPRDREQGLAAEASSGFRCPVGCLASPTLPTGAKLHTHPVPWWSHSGFLREDDFQPRSVQGAGRG